MNAIYTRWILYMFTVFSALACSDKDDELSILESKEDIIGYWAIETYNYTVVQNKQIVREGVENNAGRLLIMEDGSAQFMNNTYSWYAESDGFELSTADGMSFEFDIISVDYHKMVAQGERTYWEDNMKYHENITIHCRRIPSMDTSLNPDNALLVGEWRNYNSMKDPSGDIIMEMEMLYNFKANGEYQFTMLMTGQDPIIEIGTFDYNINENSLTTLSSEGSKTVFKLTWNNKNMIIDDGNSTFEYIKKQEQGDNGELVGKWRHYATMNMGGVILEEEMIYEFNEYGEYTFLLNCTGMDKMKENGKFTYDKKAGTLTTVNNEGIETVYAVTWNDGVMVIDSHYNYVKQDPNQPQQQSIVGSWICSKSEKMPDGSSFDTLITYEFKADGSYFQTMKFTGMDELQDNGTYSHDQKAETLTIISAVMDPCTFKISFADGQMILDDNGTIYNYTKQ